jgi:hypothetical protein
MGNTSPSEAAAMSGVASTVQMRTSMEIWNTNVGRGSALINTFLAYLAQSSSLGYLGLKGEGGYASPPWERSISRCLGLTYVYSTSLYGIRVNTGNMHPCESWETLLGG